MLSPLALKPIAILSIALGVSLLANVGFLYFAGRSAGKAASAETIQTLETNLASAQQTNAVGAALAKARDEQRASLLAAVNDIAAEGVRTNTIYKTIAVANPLAANCAPGKERIDTVNNALKGEAD